MKGREEVYPHPCPKGGGRVGNLIKLEVDGVKPVPPCHGGRHMYLARDYMRPRPEAIRHGDMVVVDVLRKSSENQWKNLRKT